MTVHEAVSGQVLEGIYGGVLSSWKLPGQTLGWGLNPCSPHAEEDLHCRCGCRPAHPGAGSLCPAAVTQVPLILLEGGCSLSGSQVVHQEVSMGDGTGQDFHILCSLQLLKL